jgi:broad specificity phosphatase PhoE
MQEHGREPLDPAIGAQPPEGWQAFRSRPSLLVIVRHGQSLRNTFDVHEGIAAMPRTIADTPDHLIPLTGEGEEQARATGQGLRAEFGGFDFIYHSPWVRTTQTAQLLASELPAGALIRRNLFLTEQHFGELDPCLWPHRLERYEEAYRVFEERRAIAGRFYTRPPDGESWSDVCIRTHQFLSIIFRPDHHGARVLVVTHGVTQQSFRYHLEHPTEEELVEMYARDRNRNCGAGAYSWSRDAGWRLLCWHRVYAAEPPA